MFKTWSEYREWNQRMAAELPYDPEEHRPIVTDSPDNDAEEQ